MFEFLTDILRGWAEVLSPPWFTFFGTMLEEVIAPIPSPLVMTLAGSLAASLDKSVWYLLFLAITGTAGKTIGAYVIYLIADKFEDVLTTRFGKWLGITHQQIEKIGARLGKGWQDNIAIFVLRALPIIPTAPVSLMAGILKLDLKTYLVSSALGIFVRNIFYLYLGFTSVGALENINNNLASWESLGSIVVLILIAALIYYIYRKRRQLWQDNVS
jgi:membrane protein DedA with SNARE-associated domain